MIYVVAKTGREAENWARMMRLAPADWQYVEDADSLRGVRLAPQYVVQLPGWDLRMDDSALRDVIQAAVMSHESRYCIKSDYRHRDRAAQSASEVNQTDECQDEVYATAAEEARRLGARRILDVGCGGGYKLLKHFPLLEFETLGLDSARTVAYLKDTYKWRNWLELNLSQVTEDDGARLRGLWDMVICSDVIEHVPEPDALVGFLRGVGAPVVVSTPNRDVLPDIWAQGPPRNAYHYREWNVEEFSRYLNSHGFDAWQHVPNWKGASSQVAVGRFS